MQKINKYYTKQGRSYKEIQRMEGLGTGLWLIYESDFGKTSTNLLCSRFNLVKDFSVYADVIRNKSDKM